MIGGRVGGGCKVKAVGAKRRDRKRGAVGTVEDVEGGGGNGSQKGEYEDDENSPEAATAAVVATGTVVASCVGLRTVGWAEGRLSGGWRGGAVGGGFGSWENSVGHIWWVAIRNCEERRRRRRIRFGERRDSRGIVCKARERERERERGNGRHPKEMRTPHQIWNLSFLFLLFSFLFLFLFV
ncbi:hypothetical protein OWV82_018185 [Melia azedarach]|uniref:Uncharacterized protein n=1 Tax=Melia azedarach TaxID=155640 RepID=A0ACC1XBW5_MELAZ|nr:hypothetical protein OWV82_018185 [Melia azedarach]